MNISRGPPRGKYTPTNYTNDSQSEKKKHPQKTPNSMYPQVPPSLKPYNMPQPPPYPLHVPPVARMQFHPWMWGPFNPQRMPFIPQRSVLQVHPCYSGLNILSNKVET